MSLPRQSRASLPLALGLFAALLCAPAARGQQQQAFEEQLHHGIALYNAGRYAECIGAFTAAYAMKPLPNLLFNIAQAHRRLGHTAEAVAYYQRFLRTEPGPAPDIAADIQRYLAEAQRGRPADRLRRPRRVQKAAPGDGEERAAPGEAAPAPDKEVVPAAEPAPAPPSAALPAAALSAGPPPRRSAPPRRIYQRWWFWGAAGLLAAGAAGAVTGAVLATRPVAPPEPAVQPTYDLFP